MIQMIAVNAERGTHYGMAELKTDGRLYYKGRLKATNVKDIIDWFATNRPHIKLKPYTPPAVTEYCF
jgi:hypothetical protein